MDENLGFDWVTANRYFATECFNSTWKLMEKPTRTAAEDEQMLLRAFASFFHWTQRPDCTPENRSISLWQIARVYALTGQPASARRYGKQCLAESESANLPPFYIAYAYEALARAEMVAGDKVKMQEYVSLAHKISEQGIDGEDRQALLADLATIQL